MTKFIFDDAEFSWKNTTLIDFLKHHSPHNWYDFFNNPEQQEQLIRISGFLNHEAKNVTIYPSINNVFKALYDIDLPKLNLVILGQDCYHNGAATGRAFEVANGHNINPSLRNIYTEAINCGFNPNKNGNLEYLAKQGVLLLNTALTVRAKSPESHVEIWSQFTENLIKYICQQKTSCVWFLMGTKAQNYEKLIPKSHQIIKTTHPSPLSCYRSTKKIPAFIGSNCFTLINNELKKYGKFITF